jgi:3-methyladenine DNA glycosylase AlkC
VPICEDASLRLTVTTNDNVVVPPKRRTGATRRDQIPADVREELNRGTLETATLAEWLAVDMEVLFRSVMRDVGLSRWRARLLKSTRGVNALGVTRRLECIGRAIHEVIQETTHFESVLGAMKSHRSDVVRQWATYAAAADSSRTVASRIQAMRPFAADRNMSVRECAWMAVRPVLVLRTVECLAVLEPLAHDSDPNMRRFASEVSRPRSVWCHHAPLLKAAPDLAHAVLDPLKADPSVYVRLSVGNWLNDASKTRPDWVQRTCRRWLLVSDSPATQHIVRRGLRTLAKAGLQSSEGTKLTY